MNSAYWDQRYQQGQTGWDIGYANPVLVHYVLDHYSKDSHILIPGAGRAYEAEALWKAGYKRVHPCDFAPSSKREFLERVPDFPEEHYLLSDFFALEAQFDLVLEQTFFCAIDPSLRTDYTQHMRTIVKEGGKLAGLLFEMDKPDGPPFGGHRDEYIELFSPYFEVLRMDECVHSIPPRMGRELFFELRKPGT